MRLLVFTLLIFSSIISANIRAGSTTTIPDSLTQSLNLSNSDSTRAHWLNKITEATMFTDNDTALYYGKQALLFAEKSGSKVEQSAATNNLGIIFYLKSMYADAKYYYSRSAAIREELNDSNAIASCYNNLGALYIDLGNYNKALEYFLKVVSISEKAGYKTQLSQTLNNIGLIYYSTEQYDKSLECFIRSAEIKGSINDTLGLAHAYNNIGEVYRIKRKYADALGYFNKCLEIFERYSDPLNLSKVYTNIGLSYEYQNKYKLAESYFLKALKIKEEQGYSAGIALMYYNLGSLYFKLGEIKKSQNHLLKSLEYLNEKENIDLMVDVYLALSQAHESNGQTKEALTVFKEYSRLKDSLHKNEWNENLADNQIQYETLEKEKEIEGLNKDKKIKDLEIFSHIEANRKQKIIIYAFIVGLTIVLFLLVIIFRQLKLRRKANIVLIEQKAEIETQRDEIESQRNSLAKINAQITDSIGYARRIQSAILPSEKLYEEHFAETWILFQPKDIVSGDFYWISCQGSMVFTVVADCTGHGVPGAFMSMIGNALLNQIVNEEKVFSPAEILQKLHEGIIYALSRHDTIENDDGMDISIVRYNKQNGELLISGTNQPVFLIRKDGSVIPFKGRIIPIGSRFAGRLGENFPELYASFDEIDEIIMMSDGITDQFGGETNEKFGIKRMQNLLNESIGLPAEQQKAIFSDALSGWMNQENKIYSQIDDIAIVGLKFGLVTGN